MPETGNPKWIALTRVSIVLAIATTVVMLFVTAVLVSRLNAQATKNRALNLTNRELIEQIQSCINPGGECYRQNQQRSQDLVGEPRGPINTVVVAVTSCADRQGSQSEKEILDCVAERLKLLSAKHN